MALDILYEDNHLIAVNKPAGTLVQGDKTGDTPLVDEVKAYIKTKYNKPGEVFLGVIHRLDRPTSGIVVFARTSKALARMNKLFAARETEKTYWAVTEKMPESAQGELKHYLWRNTKQNKSYAYDHERKDSKLAHLSYQVVQSSDRYHLIEVQLHTGRHHQIRVQLSHEGAIIKGDLKYGAARSNKDASIHLHARKLSFVHPVKKEKVTFIAPVPKADTLWQFFENSNQ